LADNVSSSLDAGFDPEFARVRSGCIAAMREAPPAADRHAEGGIAPQLHLCDTGIVTALPDSEVEVTHHRGGTP
jgi:hypothetical protein